MNIDTFIDKVVTTEHFIKSINSTDMLKEAAAFISPLAMYANEHPEVKSYVDSLIDKFHIKFILWS